MVFFRVSRFPKEGMVDLAVFKDYGLLQLYSQRRNMANGKYVTPTKT